MRRRLARFRAAIVLVCTVATVAWPSAAEASPEDIFSYGSRSPALGGTGTASASGYEAAFQNPARISLVRSRKITLGYQAATFDVRADEGDSGASGRVAYAPMRGSVIGVELPLPFGGALTDRVGVALAFYTPTDVIVRGRIVYPEKPQFPLLADRAQSLGIRMGLGVSLGYGLRFGVGFAALAEIAGTVLVATDASGRVGSRVEDQLVATYAPIVGATFDLPVRGPGVWRVGLVYRGTLDARFEVAIDATKLSTLNLPVFNIAGTAQYDPAQVALEVAHERGAWAFALGATFKRWSRYPGLVEPTIRCPEGSPDCGALTPAKVELSDTLVLRVGVERRLALAEGADLHLRGGAFYEPTPVPENLPASEAFDPATRENVEVPTRFYDASRVAVTVGSGLSFARIPLSLDTFAQVHAMPERTVTHSGVTRESGAKGARLSGLVLMTGVTLGVRF